MAQMGFMLVQVALGAVAAAVVHLVGHAMYKAALFLGSGSAITAGRRRAAALPGRRLPAPQRAAAAVVLPLGALTAAVAVAGGLDAVGGPGAAVLLAFAWASGAQAVDGWLRTGPPAALGAALAGTAVAAAAYVGLLAGAKAFLAPSLPAVSGIDPWLAAALVPAVVAATAVRILGPTARPAAATAYAWLLDAGAVVRDGRRRRRPRALRAPAVGLGRPAEVVS
jgi:NADH-quinone oxidoreductase subunit L/NAD(P)H-quinone oxidoreductase subunit 5